MGMKNPLHEAASVRRTTIEQRGNTGKMEDIQSDHPVPLPLSVRCLARPNSGTTVRGIGDQSREPNMGRIIPCGCYVSLDILGLALGYLPPSHRLD